MPAVLEQAENLERVNTRIGAAIVQFFRTRKDPLFYAEELRDYVRLVVGIVAPGSPDRIMRDLRQKNVINYRVVSRSRSLYEILRTQQEKLF